MTSGIGKRRSVAQQDPNNESYQQRRKEIFEAAAHVFKAKGFKGASFSDIAAHLETDRANLYYYVGSKEELFEGTVTAAVDHNLERAKAIQATDQPAPDKLRILVTELMESYAEHFPFLYVYIQENLSQMPKKQSAWAEGMRQKNHDYEKVVVEIVTAGYREGTLREVAPAWVVAYGIIGLVGWTHRWFDPSRSPVDATAIGSAYAELVLSGLTLD